MAHVEDLDKRNAKSVWCTPRLWCDGELRDLVKGGTGKLLISAKDSGDTNKPKGQE